VTSQISVAANRGGMNWADLHWQRSYRGLNAYSQSKIALGLFGLELERRSQAGGWGITSNLAHPGIAPTNLLGARPELGRRHDTRLVRLIRALSARGILVGSVQSAQLPALYAATFPEAEGGRFYGPKGLGHFSGPPAEQALYSRLRNPADAERIWQVSEELTLMKSV
jgi:NAD(P)-dependent dehydrogenase (short-subunit alcohol dehydrogenase family)